MTDSWVIAAMMRREPQRHNGQIANLRRRPRPGDKGHVDEVCITINKERHSL